MFFIFRVFRFDIESSRGDKKLTILHVSTVESVHCLYRISYILDFTFENYSLITYI